MINKPDFASLTGKELKAYAMIHRDDGDVFKELTKRVIEHPKAITFPYLMTEEDEKKAMELFRRAGEKKSE
jgi:hypothetical protein